MTERLRSTLRTHPRLRTVLVTGLAALFGFVLVAATYAARDHAAGDEFDLVRWQRTAIWGKWIFHLGSPLRNDPQPDDAIARYFALDDPDSPEARELENAVERAIEGRIDAVLAEFGLNARIPLPGTVFPPVAIELTSTPRVLVESPRAEIRRARVVLLRPELTVPRLLEVEAEVEARSPDRSALVVRAGGMATYPAMIAPDRSYRAVVQTAAHEWVHHYLAFYPLGVRYFESGDLMTINETVADVVGFEVADRVLQRFGDPTVPSPPPVPHPDPEPTAEPELPTQPPPVPEPVQPPSYFLTLHDLRLEVGELLAVGEIEAAEARMEEVRQELESQGWYFRRINQAFFAWTGTYAARPDAVDPLGSQIQELRNRSDSLSDFVELIRGVTSRGDVEALLLDGAG